MFAAIFNEKIEIRESCKVVHCVDLGESFPTSIYLQKSASIQPRTSLVQFARSPRTDPPGISTLTKRKWTCRVDRSGSSTTLSTRARPWLGIRKTDHLHTSRGLGSFYPLVLFATANGAAIRSYGLMRILSEVRDRRTRPCRSPRLALGS